MARSTKTGLNYFPVDCTFDDNLEYVEAKHGITGLAVVIKLWQKIYRNDGYFCEWSDKNKFLFARDLNIDSSFIEEVVEMCLELDLFDRRIFAKSMVLTSRGIQKRWLKIVTDAKRKDVQIEPKFCLLELTPEEITDNSGNTPEFNAKTPGEMQQRKVKERKEKERRGEETRAIAPEPPQQPPEYSEVEKFFVEKGFSNLLARRAFDYYENADWKDKNDSPVRNWKNKMITVWMTDDEKKKQNEKSARNPERPISGYGKF